ncbi:MAG: hypothetical protein PHC92_10345 [Syntrophomonadaceae bacterium]|nr:hypothetical protein [Syntrophomonadaceae bacterium]MDD3023785.1 hypothetical protein [Syntrophomonadaceae bacterium]
MTVDITLNEVELLNAYQILGPASQKGLKDYMRYLLYKQYKREVMVAVFNNKLLHNLFHSLLHIVEKDDFDLQQVEKRVKQIKELYYGLFGQVHGRYNEVVNDLDSSEVVREFGRNGFETIEKAILSGNQTIIRFEIIDFFQGYNKLSQKKDVRNIVAV